MMAIDVERVQLDSRQNSDETIDLSLPKPAAFFCYTIDFSCGIPRELCLETLASKKVMI